MKTKSTRKNRRLRSDVQTLQVRVSKNGISLSEAWMPFIDRAAAILGLDRAAFILLAVQEKSRRERRKPKAA